VPGRGAGQERANCLNGLPIASDDAADIGLPHGEPEDGRVPVRTFGDDDFVGKLNQLANDELEELFHALSLAGVFVLSLTSQCHVI
jgi:hypothetical protein